MMAVCFAATVVCTVPALGLQVTGGWDNEVPTTPTDSAPATAANAALELDAGVQNSVPAKPETSDGPAQIERISMPSAEDVAIQRGVRERDVDALSVPWYRSGIVSLGLVLAAITAVALIARRFIKTSRGAGAEMLQVLQRTHLSPKQSIALVQMGGRLVFIGITPEQIATLRIVEDSEEAALLRGKLRASRLKPEDTAFHRLLSSETKQFTDDLMDPTAVNCGAPGGVVETRNDLHRLLDRLRAYQTGRPLHKKKESATSEPG